jgi:hypothetical protein
MNLEVHAQCIANWLEAVDLTSAPTRIAMMQEENSSKHTMALVAAGGGAVERAALHESAHAVVANQLGLNVVHTCVRADASGSAAYEAAETTPDTLLSMAIASLAGVALELLIGCDHCRQFELANGHDVMSARMSIGEVLAHAPDWSLNSRHFAILAVCSVEMNLDLIHRVAGALRSCRELDGAAIEALCGLAH